MTGYEVFTMAMDICGLRKVNRDIPDDALDLHSRALTLLNITLAENSSLDCRIRKIEHKVLHLNALAEPLECSDIVAVSVLPYGVARLMMLGEDDSLAADINKLYNEAREKALEFGKAKVEPITEVYS